jgi:hypothetical protein
VDVVSAIVLAVSVVCLLGSCAALLCVVRATREARRFAMRARGDAFRAEVASERAVEVAGAPTLADVERWREQQSKAIGLDL